jgi:hypothetical protein
MPASIGSRRDDSLQVADAERGPLRTAVDAVEHGLDELASELKTHQSATFRPCWSCHKRPVGLGRQERAVVNAHEREGLTLRAGGRGGRYGPLRAARQYVVFVQKNGVLLASFHVTVTVMTPAALAAFVIPMPWK